MTTFVSEPGGPSVVVRTAEGALRGVRVRGTTVFRGVPYCRPPVGLLRFASPRTLLPWPEVRDATRFGDPFVQAGPGGGSEDALTANVWTPDVDGSRPVLIYIHGGGWQVGAGSLPTYDGALLAAEGGLVVVTFNYRLGPFGFGRHEELEDPDTGLVANWGLQDQLALLWWVHRNAAAFGGDPGNITLAGTSAGGASAHQLAMLPQTGGIVRRIVAISAAHVRAPLLSMTPDDSRTAYDMLAARLGTTVPGLHRVPAPTLLAVWGALFAGCPTRRPVRSGRAFRGPVLDAATMPAYDHDLDPPDVPVMSVHTRTEGSFFTVPGLSVLEPPPAPVDAAGLRRTIRSVLHTLAVDVPEDDVRDCLRIYGDAAVAGAFAPDPATVWAEVLGDALLRHRILQMAQRHARTSPGPLHAMEFAHPALLAGLGTPHEATSKFLFGTHAAPGNVRVFGDGPLERRVGATFRRLVASFARHGRPGGTAGLHWTPLRPDGSGLLVLGGLRVAAISRVETSERLRFWDRPGLAPWAAPTTPPLLPTTAEPEPVCVPSLLGDRRTG